MINKTVLKWLKNSILILFYYLFIFPLRIMDTFFSAAYHPIGVFLDESIQSYSSNTVQLSLALALGIKYNKVC